MLFHVFFFPKINQQTRPNFQKDPCCNTYQKVPPIPCWKIPILNQGRRASKYPSLPGPTSTSARVIGAEKASVGCEVGDPPKQNLGFGRRFRDFEGRCLFFFLSFYLTTVNHEIVLAYHLILLKKNWGFSLGFCMVHAANKTLSG